MYRQAVRPNTPKVRLCCTTVLLTGLAASHASASMTGAQETVIDFTDAEQARNLADWSPPQRLDIGSNGLGWDGKPDASHDVWIRPREPMAIGWSWRPTFVAFVRAELAFHQSTALTLSRFPHPPGQLYARFSPDLAHWSTWQPLDAQPQGREPGVTQYHGVFRVPYREREAYAKLLSRYSQRDVPWASDEEAAVKWILQEDSDFFEKQLPFIGYVEFLYEDQFHGGRRLKQLKLSVAYSAGGLHVPPRDPKGQQDREGPASA